MECLGGEAAFPPIATLSTAQRKRVTFAMIPPGMTLVFAPNAVAYQLVTAVSAEGTTAANDRVTGGGWLVPRSTLELPDFAERAAQVREGGGKIWAQDVPINCGRIVLPSRGEVRARPYGPPGSPSSLTQSTWMFALFTIFVNFATSALM